MGASSNRRLFSAAAVVLLRSPLAAGLVATSPWAAMTTSKTAASFPTMHQAASPGDRDGDHPETSLPPTRLFAISDVHVDDPANMAWVRAMAPRPNDALIVAGDVSDDLPTLREALRAFKSKYGEVFYCPGNHEAWVVGRRGGEDGTEGGAEIADSLAKLEAVRRVAESEGVRTGVGAIGDTKRRCVVAPLLSWHHASFDTEPAIERWRGIPSARLVMADYRRCRWPDPLRDDDESVARHVDTLNQGVEQRVAELRANDDDDAFGGGGHCCPETDVVSFSHFVPRIELVPEKRFLFLPTLTQAVGSRFLGDRVRRLEPDVHVFGHVHFGWDATLDGVRYVQAALAYPNEWRSRPASLAIGDLDVVVGEQPSEEDEAPRPRGPLLIWDSASGVVADEYSARWSDHYKRFPRTPELTHVLPPYTARLYRPLPGSAVREVEDHVRPFAR
mmetsp:Transcript_20879/g.83209  ORF Transcript_20879/g.83209 Transcript_20879/m.83209 type:complete len:446 (-) Transcript_20879:1473-2810(-)